MIATEGVIRLAAVRDAPLSIDEVYAAVRDPTAGGVALFVGVVRTVDHGRAVASLSYTTHPTVEDSLEQIVRDVGARHDVVALAAVHRVGDLAVGDLAVVVAASAAHRGQALDATRDLIDEIKSGIPIWKHQRFDDGTDEWVGSP